MDKYDKKFRKMDIGLERLSKELKNTTKEKENKNSKKVESALDRVSKKLENMSEEEFKKLEEEKSLYKTDVENYSKYEEFTIKEDSKEVYLIKQNHDLREAGLELCEVCNRVIKDYDGIHRLSLAVSKFYFVIANEGNRGK